MSVETLNKNLQTTYEWISYIEAGLTLGEENKDRALALLKAVLQTLRDHMEINELSHFSAQLPILIRGILFENWNPQHNLIRDRSKEGFVADVLLKLPKSYYDVDIEDAIKVVFNTIALKIDYEEFCKLKNNLPHHIREMIEQYILYQDTIVHRND